MSHSLYKSSTIRSGARRGFTLVELLVVIGIIALLISILLPALGRARDQANRTKCMSNQRQLMMAVLQYTNDFKGVMPFPNWFSYERSGPYAGKPGWLYTLSLASFPMDYNKPEFIETGLLWPYMNHHEAYRCPADMQGPWKQDSTQNLTSYIMNGAVCSFGRVYPSNKITRFKGDVVIFWESDEQQGSWNDGSEYPSEKITRRHGKGGSFACIDGHVEWMGYDQWEKDESQRKPGRAWCSSDSPTGE